MSGRVRAPASQAKEETPGLMAKVKMFFLKKFGLYCESEVQAMLEKARCSKGGHENEHTQTLGSSATTTSPRSNMKKNNSYPSPPFSTHAQGIAPTSTSAGKIPPFSKTYKVTTKRVRTKTKFTKGEDGVLVPTGASTVEHITIEDEVEAFEEIQASRQPANNQAENNQQSKPKLI